MTNRRYGSIVVDVLNGKVGCVVERYGPSFGPYYTNWRIRFPHQTYRVVRDRHLREPMPGEIRAIRRLFEAERTADKARAAFAAALARAKASGLTDDELEILKKGIGRHD